MSVCVCVLERKREEKFALDVMNARYRVFFLLSLDLFFESDKSTKTA